MRDFFDIGRLVGVGACGPNLSVTVSSPGLRSQLTPDRLRCACVCAMWERVSVVGLWCVPLCLRVLSCRILFTCVPS